MYNDNHRQGKESQPRSQKGKTMQKKYYESRTEIINHEILPSLGDAAADFDIEAIADEVTIYDFSHSPARVTMIEGDEFWKIVEKHDQNA